MGKGSPQICEANTSAHSRPKVMPREPKAVNTCTPGAPSKGPTTGKRSWVVQRTPAQLRKLASNGYVRSNLYVLKSAGGGSAAAVAESTLLGGSTALASEQTYVTATSVQAVASVAYAETGGLSAAVSSGISAKMEKIREARLKGYEGDSCGECGNFTLVRNGTCMKCNTCGSTSGCS